MGAALERVKVPAAVAKNMAVNTNMARGRLDDGLVAPRTGLDPGARVAERRARVAKALDARVGEVPGARAFEVSDAHIEKALVTGPRAH